MMWCGYSKISSYTLIHSQIEFHYNKWSRCPLSFFWQKSVNRKHNRMHAEKYIVQCCPTSCWCVINGKYCDWYLQLQVGFLLSGFCYFLVYIFLPIWQPPCLVFLRVTLFCKIGKNEDLKTFRYFIFWQSCIRQYI